MKDTKYKEIFKLKEMLEKLDMNPPIKFIDRTLPNRYFGIWEMVEDTWVQTEYNEKYQILVFKKNGDRFMSIIEGWGTYGSEDDKLEIMASFNNGDVRGYLTAQEVYDLILNNYEV